jgi:cupin fold WbuC family metalloprotein
MEEMKQINQAIFSELSVKAAMSPRKRSHFNLHEQLNDPIQRLLVAIDPGSYIRPHRHPEPNKWECFFVIKGSAEVLIFSEDGKVIDKTEIIDGGNIEGVEISAGAWHTLIASSSGTILFELKPGPYQPLSEKDFAYWAPVENSDSCSYFGEWFRKAEIGAFPPNITFRNQ